MRRKSYVYSKNDDDSKTGIEVFERGGEMHINSPRNLIFVRGRERERGLGEGTSRLMFSFSAQDDSVISDRNECVDSSPFFHHLTDIPLFFFLSLSLKIIWGFFSLHHTFLDDKLMRSK